MDNASHTVKASRIAASEGKQDSSVGMQATASEGKLDSSKRAAQGSNGEPSSLTNQLHDSRLWPGQSLRGARQ
jgi:hypothetical protein